MQLTFIKSWVIFAFFGPEAYVAENFDSYDYDQTYDQVCQTMTDETEASYLVRMKNLRTIIYGDNCLMLINYPEMVAELPLLGPGWLFFIWRLCSQLSILTTNNDNIAFGEAIPLAFQEQVCNDLIGPQMDCYVSKRV